MSQKPVQQSAHPLIDKVEAMIGELMKQDWPAFKPYFAKDVYYKVGVAQPIEGPDAIANFLSHVYSKLQPTSHDIRGIWEFGNVVIVEMDANYKVIEDGRPVTVPCCDVYRFDDNGLIKQWRVYPDASDVKIQF